MESDQLHNQAYESEAFLHADQEERSSINDACVDLRCVQEYKGVIQELLIQAENRDICVDERKLRSAWTKSCCLTEFVH